MQPLAARGFLQRSDAIDFLELQLAEKGEVVLAIEALRESLAATNTRVIDRLRSRIRAGRFTRPGLMRAFEKLTVPGEGFDVLDLLVGELLAVGEPRHPTVDLEREMVAYQPAPARVILEIVRVLKPGDVFVDVGAGLGRVAILVALLTGNRAKAIELEPVYCDYARRSAAALGVEIEVVQGDARNVPLEGDVFFLFTPFRGAMLRAVLDRLPRPCTVITHGPCTREASGEGLTFIAR